MTARRRDKGRRAPEPISRAVQRLIKIAREESPAYVQRWFNDRLAEVIDDELEALALWVLGDFEPDVDVDRVRAFIAQGATRRAANAVVMQMRKETAAEIRRHKRVGIDRSGAEE